MIKALTFITMILALVFAFSTIELFISKYFEDKHDKKNDKDNKKGK